MKTLLRSNYVDTAYQRALELRDTSMYQGIVKDLKKKIGGGQFHFFGSRMMGVANDDSDIDLFIGFRKSKAIF